MITVQHRHGHKCALIAALGLPHDTPLIEWHDRTPVALAAVVSLIPFQATGGWKYLQVAKADATNRSASDYNDSTWTIGAAPWSGGASADGSGSFPAGVTAWGTGTDLWARRIVEAPAGIPMTLKVRSEVAAIYWNGVNVDNFGNAAVDSPMTEHTTVIPGASVLGSNVLAIRFKDDAVTVGPGTYADAQVTYAYAWTEYQWTLNPDRTAALVDYEATHGRPTPTQNVEPLVGTVRLARYLVDSIPVTGDRYRLTLNADVATALGVNADEMPRFTGEITDVDVTADGDLSVITVNGLGRRARLNRVPVTTSRPQETDGERVRRILAQASITLPLDVGGTDSGTVTLLEDAPQAVPAQQLIDQVTADSLGQLVEHRSGRIEYHDAGHRRGLSSLATLTGDQHLIQPFSWRQGVASIVNDASATYGPDGDRETVRVVDPTSADPDVGAGPYPVSLDTQLATAADAYALLTDLVGKYSRPSWWLPSVLVELYRTAGDQLAALLGLSHGDKITATDLPPDGAFTDGDVFVEGTTETHNARTWALSLAVADPALAGAGLRWLDLPRFLRWTDVTPGITWLDVATIADPYGLGTPVAGAGDADDIAALIVNGGNASTTSWDYVLSGALP